jgi:hypothetical protein
MEGEAALRAILPETAGSHLPGDFKSAVALQGILIHVASTSRKKDVNVAALSLRPGAKHFSSALSLIH